MGRSSSRRKGKIHRPWTDNRREISNRCGARKKNAGFETRPGAECGRRGGTQPRKRCGREGEAGLRPGAGIGIRYSVLVARYESDAVMGKAARPYQVAPFFFTFLLRFLFRTPQRVRRVPASRLLFRTAHRVESRLPPPLFRTAHRVESRLPPSSPDPGNGSSPASRLPLPHCAPGRVPPPAFHFRTAHRVESRLPPSSSALRTGSKSRNPHSFSALRPL